MTITRLYTIKAADMGCRDIVILTVYKANGMKHLSNGVYKEWLDNLKYPYRNFKSGTPVDQICNTLRCEYNMDVTENELIEYVDKYVASNHRRN
jgi:hypothetical protein